MKYRAFKLNEDGRVFEYSDHETLKEAVAECEKGTRLEIREDDRSNAGLELMTTTEWETLGETGKFPDRWFSINIMDSENNFEEFGEAEYAELDALDKERS